MGINFGQGIIGKTEIIMASGLSYTYIYHHYFKNPTLNLRFWYVLKNPTAHIASGGLQPQAPASETHYWD